LIRMDKRNKYNKQSDLIQVEKKDESQKFKKLTNQLLTEFRY